MLATVRNICIVPNQPNRICSAYTTECCKRDLRNALAQSETALWRVSSHLSRVALQDPLLRPCRILLWTIVAQALLDSSPQVPIKHHLDQVQPPWAQLDLTAVGKGTFTALIGKTSSCNWLLQHKSRPHSNSIDKMQSVIDKINVLVGVYWFL